MYGCESWTLKKAERLNYLAADLRRHRLYGRLNGTVRTDAGEEIVLSQAPCFIEHIDDRR